MGMDTQLQVGGVRAHLDRQHSFGNQFTGTRSDDADAEDALRFGIDHELSQAVGPVERERPS